MLHNLEWIWWLKEVRRMFCFFPLRKFFNNFARNITWTASMGWETCCGCLEISASRKVQKRCHSAQISSSLSDRSKMIFMRTKNSRKCQRYFSFVLTFHAEWPNVDLRVIHSKYARWRWVPASTKRKRDFRNEYSVILSLLTINVRALGADETSINNSLWTLLRLNENTFDFLEFLKIVFILIRNVN